MIGFPGFGLDAELQVGHGVALTSGLGLIDAPTELSAVVGCVALAACMRLLFVFDYYLNKILLISKMNEISIHYLI